MNRTSSSSDTGSRDSRSTLDSSPDGNPGGRAGGTVRSAIDRSGFAFVELVCADDEWVEREFAEIVAANVPPTGSGAATPVIPPVRVAVDTVEPLHVARVGWAGSIATTSRMRRGAGESAPRERGPPTRSNA